MTSTTTGEGRLLRVDQIDVPADYEREEPFDAALLKSIRKAGAVHQSLAVYPEDDRYTLIKGTRRLAVAQHLGLHTVPVVIFPAPGSDDERDRLRFILGIRQDLLPSQRAKLIQQLCSMYGLTQKQVAALLGFDPASISLWMDILHYDSSIITLIDAGTISLHAAKALQSVPKESQPKAYRSLRREFSSLSGRKLRKVVEKQFRVPKAKSKPPQKRRHKKLSRDEKSVLSRDLSLLEVELSSGQEELDKLTREIALAAVPVNAIMRSDRLRSMLSADVREEFGRFVELY